MKITATPRDVIEIKVGEQSLGLFEGTDTWKTLSEYRRLTDSETLIIVRTAGRIAFHRIFGDVFGGDGRVEAYVVDGSRQLIKEISAALKQAPEVEQDEP